MSGLFELEKVKQGKKEKTIYTILNDLKQKAEKNTQKEIEFIMKEDLNEQILYIATMFIKSQTKIAIGEGSLGTKNGRYLETLKIRNVTGIIIGEIEAIEYLPTKVKQELIEKIELIQIYALLLVENPNSRASDVMDLEKMDIQVSIEIEKIISDLSEMDKRIVRALSYAYKTKVAEVMAYETMMKNENQPVEQKKEEYQDLYEHYVYEVGEEVFGSIATEEKRMQKILQIMKVELGA